MARRYQGVNIMTDFQKKTTGGFHTTLTGHLKLSNWALSNETQIPS